MFFHSPLPPQKKNWRLISQFRGEGNDSMLSSNVTTSDFKTFEAVASLGIHTTTCSNWIIGRM